MADMKVENFNHVLLCLEYVGGKMVLNALEELQKDFPKIPGVGLAIATAKGAVSDMQSRMLARNLAQAVKNGFDPDEETLTMSVKDDGIYLHTTRENADTAAGEKESK